MPVASINTSAASASSSQIPPCFSRFRPPWWTNIPHKAESGFVNSLTAEDFTQHPVSDALYTVRTFVSLKKRSADSNVASVTINPAPDTIADLKAEITPSGVALSWTPPQKTLIGPAPPIAGYRVYRAEIERSRECPAHRQQPRHGNSQVESRHSRASPIPHRRPTPIRKIELGRTYAYTVRSLAQYPGQNHDKPLESLDSNSVTVTPKDVFPPSAPQELRRRSCTRCNRRNSWLTSNCPGPSSPKLTLRVTTFIAVRILSIPGTRVNPELLLTPAFRDMNAVPGRRYFYTVTAVDRSGNESPAGIPASGGVPARHNQSQKDPSTEMTGSSTHDSLHLGRRAIAASAVPLCRPESIWADR